MSFDTTNGTRGARQPKGALLKWSNRFVSKRIARKDKAPGMGFDALVLVTVGAKTGEERHTPPGLVPGPGRQLASRHPPGGEAGVARGPAAPAEVMAKAATTRGDAPRPRRMH